MFKILSKSKYPSEMLCFLTEPTLIIYVQSILDFERKNISLREIVRELYFVVRNFMPILVLQSS